MKTPTELPVELNLLRIVAQGLVPATAAQTPHQAVTRMLATQGQLVSAVPHSLIVRTLDATGSDVEADFDAGRLVRSWPFRGTLHIMGAEDHVWLRALWATRTDSWWSRSAEQMSMTDAEIEDARRMINDYLADGAKLRSEIRKYWIDGGVGANRSDEDRSRLFYLLFVQFHRDGTMVSGAPVANEHLVMNAPEVAKRALKAVPSGSTIADLAQRIEAGEPSALRTAYAEVARRYATSRGPVTADDLARWTGAGMVNSRRGLEDAVELSTDVFPGAESRKQLVRAHLEGKRLVEGPGKDKTNPTFYLRADLQDLLSQNLTDAKRTLYLSAFDELHVGYQNRSCLTDKEGERLICPGGNGMFRPLLVDRGRLVAVNPKSIGFQWYAQPSNRVARDVERAMRRVHKRLAE